MIKNLEFRRVHNEFQSILNNDIREIHKSNNLYPLINLGTYAELIRPVKKCNNDKTKTINIKAKKIASKLKLEDRIQILDDNDAYISIKNHKEGFPDKISCRLINPPITDIGKISKQILDKVNTSVLEKIKVIQWKNTSSVTEWYCNIKRKDQCSFVVFNIESFYPPISEKLLDKAILFAKSHYNFTPDELEIVLHSRKTLLFWNQSTWVKSMVMKILTSLWNFMMEQKYAS